jgi:hypothetical protein
MEQINGHRVSLSHRVARGLAHGLISYGQSHEMIVVVRSSRDTWRLIKSVAISATGTLKYKGRLPSTHIREMRRHFGLWVRAYGHSTGSYGKAGPKEGGQVAASRHFGDSKERATP